MHSFSTKCGFRVHHNGDFSGDIHVCRGQGNDHQFREDETDHTMVLVPFSVMLEIVAQKVRQDRIGALEQMDDHEILDCEEWRAGS